MNKAILIGNLTRDPELRSTTSGIPVCAFTIAVNRRFKDANGKKGVDFINIVVWRQLGELCAKYTAKGSKVCVTGAIQTRTYETDDGTRRTVTEINADEVEFLPSGTRRDALEGQAGAANTGASQGSAPYSDDDFALIDDDELPF